MDHIELYGYIKKEHYFGWSEGNVRNFSQIQGPVSSTDVIGSGLDKSRRQVFGGPRTFSSSSLYHSHLQFSSSRSPRLDKLKRVTTPIQHIHLSTVLTTLCGTHKSNNVDLTPLTTSTSTNLMHQRTGDLTDLTLLDTWSPRECKEKE